MENFIFRAVQVYYFTLLELSFIIKLGKICYWIYIQNKSTKGSPLTISAYTEMYHP